MKNYFYKSTSNDGWRNLAQDEWFINNMGEDELMLYLYVNENAVIIGKNQNPWKECNLSAMEQDNVQLVRRISGRRCRVSRHGKPELLLYRQQKAL